MHNIDIGLRDDRATDRGQECGVKFSKRVDNSGHGHLLFGSHRSAYCPEFGKSGRVAAFPITRTLCREPLENLVSNDGGNTGKQLISVIVEGIAKTANGLIVT